MVGKRMVRFLLECVLAFNLALRVNYVFKDISILVLCKFPGFPCLGKEQSNFVLFLCCRESDSDFTPSRLTRLEFWGSRFIFRSDAIQHCVHIFATFLCMSPDGQYKD